MDGFSGALRLTDLNDFIAPTQECIKPVKIERKGGRPGAIKISSAGDYSELDSKGQEIKLVKTEITLNDCLACSGCVTSAETVLIQQQSFNELLRVLQENIQVPVTEKKLICVSVSDQSLASLGVKYELNMKDSQEKVCGFFKSIGVDRVFSINPACNLALLESQREFVNRFQSGDRKNALPMFASACPGWICYAEKTHGSFILPHISTTKSPQQIMGSLVKNYLSEIEKRTPDNVYHVTIMMCYDKKLEASREDFYSDVYSSRDVDCVITSLEIDQMLQKQNKNLCDFPSKDLDILPNIVDYVGNTGGGSGGYLEHVFRYAAKTLFLKDIDRLEYKVIRNQDFREVTLEFDGQPKLQFAAAYGFRNIQNIVQKLKRGKCQYDFVEIMACPSGCLNGGGQIRAPDHIEPKEYLRSVETLFESPEKRSPEDSEWLKAIYENWLEGQDSAKCLKMLHTQYHMIENKNSVLNIKW